MAKTGVETNTVYSRNQLSKGDNKYNLTTEEYKEAKINNKKIDKKSKCWGCKHNKKNTRCLERGIELEELFYECNKFGKL